MASLRSGSVHVKVKTSGQATVTVRVKAEESKRLKFGCGNAKLPAHVRTFSLPAGWTCPFASSCLSKADRDTGRIQDGPKTEFRCFAASDEQIRPSVRNARWHNLSMLRGLSKQGMTELILESLAYDAHTVRIHVSGDFYSQTYFDAWLQVARQRPQTRFYAYSKALPFWVARMESIPENLILTASYGGTHDHLIDKHGLRSARVVLSEQEAADLGLELDHDDSHAMKPGPNFALLIHGMQPAKSAASKALATLRKNGEYGYGRKADLRRSQRMSLPVV